MSQRDLTLQRSRPSSAGLDSACIRVGSKACSDGKGYGGSLLPDAIRWPRGTWKLEASLKCRSCRKSFLRQCCSKKRESSKYRKASAFRLVLISCTEVPCR
ncbi:hypothetical protein GWE18_07535 [Bradyrhizobium sp. CSA112]|nr:hypothetical protein [Bradyrhizobium sp. CSA112]